MEDQQWIIIIIFIISSLFLYQWKINNRNSPPISIWPIFGMIPTLVLNAYRIHDFMADLMLETGGTFMFKGPSFFSLNFLVTSDPINLNHILSRNFSNYEKGSGFREIFEVLGNGILATDSELWKSQRRLIHSLVNNHGFETSLMKTVAKKGVEGLIPILEHAAGNGVEVDLKDLIHRLTFDILSSMTMGIDPETLSVELPEVEYTTAMTELEEALVYRHVVPERVWKLQRWLQVGEERKMRRSMDVVNRHVNQCILSKRERIQTMQAVNKQAASSSSSAATSADAGDKEEVEENVLSKLLSGDGLCNTMLRDHVFNLIAAGHDTVSAGTSWFFWCVAKYPWVESKIAEEIAAVFSGAENHEHILDKKLLDKMIYLHATVLEVLRLYPPVPINHKTSIEADTLPTGHHVNPSTRVLIPYYAIGRTKEIWGDDCLEFKPERWISSSFEGVESLIHVPSHVFATFNTGPRLCVGKETALIVIKMVAVMVIRDYNIRLVKNHHAAFLVPLC